MRVSIAAYMVLCPVSGGVVGLSTRQCTGKAAVPWTLNFKSQDPHRTGTVGFDLSFPFKFIFCCLRKQNMYAYIHVTTATVSRACLPVCLLLFRPELKQA